MSHYTATQIAHKSLLHKQYTTRLAGRVLLWTSIEMAAGLTPLIRDLPTWPPVLIGQDES